MTLEANKLTLVFVKLEISIISLKSYIASHLILFKMKT